jgi:hypothetical protein
MAGSPWLIEEVSPLDQEAARLLEQDLPTGRRGALEALTGPDLAVSLQEVVIHDNKKWFGEADIRLDALVVQGHGAVGEPESFYLPQTFRFGRVRDGEALPTGDSGLLVFYGKPLYFLDIFLTVSRDRKDSDDLSRALSGQLQSPDIQGAVRDLAGLVAAPQVAAVTAAVAAAARLGDFAYQILRSLTGTTVGLFHTSWLQHRDRFGVGRHPSAGEYRVKDLSFSYEIVVEAPEDRSG